VENPDDDGAVVSFEDDGNGQGVLETKADETGFTFETSDEGDTEPCNEELKLFGADRDEGEAPRLLDFEVEEKLLATLAQATGPEETRDRVLFSMMLWTGLRIGSAIGLDRSDIPRVAAGTHNG
jgi:integrase